MELLIAHNPDPEYGITVAGRLGPALERKSLPYPVSRLTSGTLCYACLNSR
jgi:hypothetical protein